MSREGAANDFPAIAVDRDRPLDSIRALYLCKEPELMAAIRRGDRPEATRLLNLVLVHIYSVGEERSDLLKSLLLEIVVMMSRVAVEAGASPTELLGLRFRHITELARVDDDEGLALWLRRVFLRIFAVFEERRAPGGHPVVRRALEHLREHASERLAREAVARRLGVSPSHLTHLLKEATGLSFQSLVREARVERACGLLASTDLTVAAVAAESGFCDQSYFTHVFRELRRKTPGEYRADLRAGRS